MDTKSAVAIELEMLVVARWQKQKAWIDKDDFLDGV